MTTLPELKAVVSQYTKNEAIFTFTPASANAPQASVSGGPLNFADKETIDIEIDTAAGVNFVFVETVLIADITAKQAATIGDIPVGVSDPKFVRVQGDHIDVFLGYDADNNLVYSYANTTALTNAVSLRMRTRGRFNSEFPSYADRGRFMAGSILVLNENGNGYELETLDDLIAIGGFITADTLPTDLTKYPTGLARETQLQQFPNPDTGKILGWAANGDLVNLDRLTGSQTTQTGGLSYIPLNNVLVPNRQTTRRNIEVSSPFGTNALDFDLTGIAGNEILTFSESTGIDETITVSAFQALNDGDDLFPSSSDPDLQEIEKSDTGVIFNYTGVSKFYAIELPIPDIVFFNLVDIGFQIPEQDDFLYRIELFYNGKLAAVTQRSAAELRALQPRSITSTINVNAIDQSREFAIPLFSNTHVTRDDRFLFIARDANRNVLCQGHRWNLATDGIPQVRVSQLVAAGGFGGLFLNQVIDSINTEIPPIERVPLTGTGFLSRVSDGTIAFRPVADADIPSNIARMSDIPAVPDVSNFLTADTLPTDVSKYPAGLALDTDLPNNSQLMPSGGSEDQILVKQSATDYDVAWTDAADANLEFDLETIDLMFDNTARRVTRRRDTVSGFTFGEEAMNVLAMTDPVEFEFNGGRSIQPWIGNRRVFFAEASWSGTYAEFLAEPDGTVLDTHSFRVLVGISDGNRPASYITVEATITKVDDTRVNFSGDFERNRSNGFAEYTFTTGSDFSTLIDIGEVLDGNGVHWLEWRVGSRIITSIRFSNRQFQALTAQTAGTSASTLTGNDSITVRLDSSYLGASELHLARTSTDSVLVGIVGWTPERIPDPEFLLEKLITV